MNSSSTFGSQLPSEPKGGLVSRFTATSLRVKLIGAFLCITAISVALVALFSIRIIRRELSADIDENIHGRAAQTAAIVSTLLTREVETLQAFALSKLVQSRVEEANASYRGDQAVISAQINAGAQRTHPKPSFSNG